MKSLSNEELMSFCSQMAMILHAGISAIEGLAIMREDLPDGEGKRILDVLYEQMEQTGNLAESMKETKVFPEYVCSMTEIGEQTGRLDEVMDGLALHYERERDLMDTIKSALFYPAVMLGMLTVVILILVVRVMPVFHQVLQQLGGGLTGISAGILHMGMLLSRYSMVFVGILILLVTGIVWLSATEKGRLAFRKWMDRSGFLGKTAEKIACSRIAEGLSLCMFSGLDLDQSLEMTVLLWFSGVSLRLRFFGLQVFFFQRLIDIGRFLIIQIVRQDVIKGSSDQDYAQQNQQDFWHVAVFLSHGTSFSS